MPEFPSGIVTLLFTDIEGFSGLSERHGRAFEPAHEEHDRIVREALASYSGIEIKTIGDAFFIVFAQPTDALAFAVEIQRRLLQHDWSQFLPELNQLLVRIGIHSGEATLRRHPSGAVDYFGPAVNRAARVESAGHGGQILLSQAVQGLVAHALPPKVFLKELGRHRLKGVGEENIWQVCHPDLPSEFAPLSTLPSARHNLPLPQTPFVGREEEVENCIALLREPSTRLLTLLAFGGMGKTRMALQIAELSFDDYKDGVWWIEVENATTGEEMVVRIADSLRLHLQPQPSVREQLLEYLKDRQILLVLDNTEQVQGDEAADVVHGVLNSGPGVKCLVTSRRSLNIALEQVVELSPLPPADAESLFVQRAKARKANFSPDGAVREDISAICRTLEGVPLAIEISASLIALLAPKQILKKLDDQLKVLVSRDPARPRRQQALRAAIDWSHDLLNDDIKTLFAQLSVFAAGFTAEAAEVVCQNEEGDIFDGLMELRNHSLLRAATDESSGQERLMMLESVRSYASEKLRENEDEYLLARGRHAEYFLKFFEEHAACLRTREEVEALCAMEAEFDNGRVALHWAQEYDAAICTRLALAFHRPLHDHGLWSEARETLEIGKYAAASLSEKADKEVGVLRARLHHALAALAHDMGETQTAQQSGEQNLLEFQRLNDAVGIADALNLLALLSTEEGDYKRAEELCERALQQWPASHAAGRAKTLHNLARLAARRGDEEEARHHYEECLTQRKRAGDARGEAETLGNLGVLAQNKGDAEEARRCYQKSLHLRCQLRERHGVAIMLHNLGELAELESDFLRAISLFVHAERIFDELQSPYMSASRDALRRLRDLLPEEEYSGLRQRAEQTVWEEFC